MRLKFAIIGPSGCGKTVLANLLGGENENTGGRLPTRPTNSLRIVEYSLPNVELRKHTAEVDVQLWEIGGNPRLRAIWPAVQNNLDGVILLYDVNNEAHIREASNLHMNFVTHSNSNISPTQCMLVGNVFRGQRDSGPQKIIGVGPKVRHIAVNLDDDSNQLREEFKNFLTGVAQIIYDKEKAILMTKFRENPQERLLSRKLSKKELRDMKKSVKNSPKNSSGFENHMSQSPKINRSKRRIAGNVRRDSAFNFEMIDGDETDSNTYVTGHNNFGSRNERN